MSERHQQGPHRIATEDLNAVIGEFGAARRVLRQKQYEIARLHVSTYLPFHERGTTRLAERDDLIEEQRLFLNKSRTLKIELDFGK
jgi:hypothetical protein